MTYSAMKRNTCKDDPEGKSRVNIFREGNNIEKDMEPLRRQEGTKEGKCWEYCGLEIKILTGVDSRTVVTWSWGMRTVFGGRRGGG